MTELIATLATDPVFLIFAPIGLVLVVVILYMLSET